MESNYIDLSCNFCSTKFSRLKSRLKRSKSGLFYCSNKCQSESRAKHSELCLNCSGPKDRSKGKKFCSHKCQQEFRTKTLIEQWKAGEIDGCHGEATAPWIKKYLIDKYGDKCSVSTCNWAEINPVTGKVPIQIDHIDGNFQNNKEENLRLLCPNCHSLTPTFGSLNRGKGGRRLGRD